MNQELLNSIPVENAYDNTQQLQPMIIVTSENFPVFDALFDTLNQFVDNITIEFRDQGIRILEVDDHKSILLHVKINSEAFQVYQMTQTNNIASFNLTQLCAFIKLGKKEKQIKCTDIFSMRVDGVKIYFDFFDKTNETTLTYKTLLLDCGDKQTQLPQSVAFEKIVTIETSAFFKTCKILKQNTTHAEFLCTNKIFTIDTGILSKSFKKNEQTKILSQNDNNVDTRVIAKLNDFSQCERLGELTSELHLFFKNNFPIFVEIPLANMGKFLMGVSNV